jgi:hypothetical protein
LGTLMRINQSINQLQKVHQLLGTSLAPTQPQGKNPQK